MFEPPIQDILTRRLQQLPALIVAPHLQRDIDDLVAMHLPSGIAAVIDDMNTSSAYGDLVFRALKGHFAASHLTLSKGVQADEDALAEIEHKTKKADFLVAVGSGTINDLVKYAAHKAGKPYIIFPTAASMNGYVSANASISIAGKKQSLAATLPLAVLVDMQLIANAPTRLSQAGLGDSFARPTAQADWLLSHHLTGETYDNAPYDIIKPYEAPVFEQAEGIARRDVEAIQALFTLLILSGFGMTIAGSSRPASGAEHMIAHMLTSTATLHGEEIAMTSVEMAARQAKLLASTRWIINNNAQEIHASIKACEAAREAISAIHITPEKLAHIRKKASLPESLETLGWTPEAYADALANARFTRDRFTCLNIETL